MNKFTYIISGIPLILTLIFGFQYSKYSRMNQEYLKRPSTIGTVLSSTFYESDVVDVNAEDRTIYPEPPLKMEYEYEVEGTKYRGHRISNLDTISPKDYARAQQEYYKKYLEGSTVKVMYKKTKPEDSLLEVDTTRTKLFQKLMFVCLFLGIGLFALNFKNPFK